MARPRTDVESVSISFRVPIDEKDRLLAVLLDQGEVADPADINLSESIREILTLFEEQYEALPGVPGREGLAVRLNVARVKALERKLKLVKSDRSKGR